MLFESILDDLQLRVWNLSPTLRPTSTVFVQKQHFQAQRDAFVRKREAEIDILLSMNEGIKKEDEQNLSPLDYHLQKYNFMINDSFVPEKKLHTFSHIYHSCA